MVETAGAFLKPGVYKVPYPPHLVRSLSSLLGKNIKLGRGDGNIKARNNT